MLQKLFFQCLPVCLGAMLPSCSTCEKVFTAVRAGDLRPDPITQVSLARCEQTQKAMVSQCSDYLYVLLTDMEAQSMVPVLQ